MSSQTFDRTANAGMRAIVLMGPDDPPRFAAVDTNLGNIGPYMSSGAAAASLQAAASAARGDLDKTLNQQNLHLGHDFQVAIASVLRRDGYVVTPESGTAENLDQAGLSAIFQSDAILYVKVGGLYSDSALDQTYEPTVYAEVQLVDSKSKETLFEHTYVYKSGIQAAGATTFEPNPKYNFASYDEMLTHPQQAAQGIEAAIPLIANAIGASLARK